MLMLIKKASLESIAAHTTLRYRYQEKTNIWKNYNLVNNVRAVNIKWLLKTTVSSTTKSAASAFQTNKHSRQMKHLMTPPSL